MRKLFAIVAAMLAASLFAFTAASCGGDDVVEGDDGIVVVQNGAAIYHKDADPSTQKTLTIGFTEAGFGREWLVELSKSFIRENHNVRIELTGDPMLADSLGTKLDSGRNLSDIFIPLNSAWELWAVQGKLEPLDDLYAMTPDGTDTVEQLTDENYRAWCKYSTPTGDHYYALPWNDAVTGIVYNKKMFREHGWQVPTTTAELKDLCDKIIKETNIKPFGYPGKIGGYFDYIGTTWWMQSIGLDQYKEFFKFESAAVYNPNGTIGKGKIKALEEFKKFFGYDTDYYIPGSQSKDHTLAQMDFIRGQCAMIVNGNWMQTEMKSNTPADFEMGFMSVPFIDGAYSVGGTPVQYNYTTAPDYMIIPSGAKEKELAKQFLCFSLKQEELVRYTSLTGSPRPFKYTIDTTKLTDFAKDVMNVRANSERFFDSSRAPVYMNGYARKYGEQDPYTAIYSATATDTNSPRYLVSQEYQYAVNNWNNWLSSSH